MAKNPEIVGAPEQWPFLRWIQNSILSLERSAERGRQAEVNANKSQNAALDLLTAQVAALPIVVGDYFVSYGFGFVSGGSTLREERMIIPIPRGKNTVVVTAIGTASILDTQTGGIASMSVALDGLFALDDGWRRGTTVPGSKDAGASMVQNTSTVAFGFTQSGIKDLGDFEIAFMLTVTNPAAFPVVAENFLSITVTAVFS